MVSRFVEPDKRVLLTTIVNLMSLLDDYDGEPIVPEHPLAMCQFLLAFGCIATNSPHQRERLVRPMSRLWRVMVYASNDGCPCYLPSEWPELDITGSTAATPKIARDWRNVLVKYLDGFKQLVSSGRYDKVVRSLDSRRAEAILEQWLDRKAGYGARVEE